MDQERRQLTCHFIQVKLDPSLLQDELLCLPQRKIILDDGKGQVKKDAGVEENDVLQGLLVVTGVGEIPIPRIDPDVMVENEAALHLATETGEVKLTPDLRYVFDRRVGSVRGFDLEKELSSVLFYKNIPFESEGFRVF